MSAFIGPIHYWLYGKIRLVSEREEYIFDKASGMCGSAADELRERVWHAYGNPLPDVDLSELLDQSNIHGWLQNQIQTVESREASFIKELLESCSGAATDLIKEAFAEHGKITGKSARAQNKYDVNTAPGIYKALNDFYLNGMPCDQADMVISSQPDSIVWKIEAYLQAPNWRRAGVDEEVMAKFYQEWISGFIGGINPIFEYRQTTNNKAGIQNEIYKK